MTLNEINSQPIDKKIIHLKRYDNSVVLGTNYILIFIFLTEHVIQAWPKKKKKVYTGMIRNLNN